MSVHQNQKANDKRELRKMIDEKIHTLQEKQKGEVDQMLKRQVSSILSLPYTTIIFIHRIALSALIYM